MIAVVPVALHPNSWKSMLPRDVPRRVCVGECVEARVLC